MKASTINAKLKFSLKWLVRSYHNTNPTNNLGFDNHDMESMPSTKNISNNQKISNTNKDDPNNTNNKINAIFEPAHQDQTTDHHQELTTNFKIDLLVAQQHQMAPEDHHLTAIFATAKAIAIDNV